LQVLRDAGIIVPEEIPSDDDSLPLDFTLLGNRDIGSVHSRYAVRHAHAIFQAAKTQARLGNLKRGLRVSKAQFRMRHNEEKLNIVQAMMEDDETIARQQERVDKAEIDLALINAVAEGYSDIRDAASREITRRIAEKAPRD
jgi:hypothetical protein